MQRSISLSALIGGEGTDDCDGNADVILGVGCRKLAIRNLTFGNFEFEN